jgi:hypothetical protein
MHIVICIRFSQNFLLSIGLQTENRLVPKYRIFNVIDEY